MPAMTSPHECELPALDRDIHLWWIHLDLAREIPQESIALLSDAERERAARYHQQADRVRMAVTRAQLRRLLAHHTGTSARQIGIVEGDGAKPRLAETGHNLHFNLAHSGEWAVIALTQIGQVGVDVENVRRLDDMASLSRIVLTNAERIELAQCEEAAREAAFFRVWVRKEAVVKALGTGLGTVLTSFAAGLQPVLPAENFVNVPQADAMRRLMLFDLHAPKEYAAALACESEPAQIVVFGDNFRLMDFNN